MKNQHEGRRVEPAVNSDVMSDAPTPADKTEVIGVVTNCLRLNLRQKPSQDSDVVTILSALSEVRVDMEASTDSFYKVCTAAGIEGFCMRKYIAIRR